VWEAFMCFYDNWADDEPEDDDDDARAREDDPEYVTG
jgi:hypothetical protein